jgi:restriction system protein
MARDQTGAKAARQGAQFVQWFGPVLDALRALGDSGTPDEVVERVAKNEKLSDAQLNELIPSGDLRFRNQVQWARYYLAQEGLIDRSQRGIWSLTEQGRKTYLSPGQARELFLKWVRIFQDRRRGRLEPIDEPLEVVAPPNDVQPTDYKIRLLEIIQTLPPSSFERLSQRVLRESGFSSVEVTGRSGDGGIDGSGTLQLNSLVSIKVLFQCKRYKDSVSPSQIRDFRGAMQGRADRGIVITTGSFTTEARREASRDGVPAIELIDGTRLVTMLEDLKLGLTPKQTFEIDERFFDEFRSGDGEVSR